MSAGAGHGDVAAARASRWAGRALLAGLLALFVCNVVAIVRNWAPLSHVTTPRGSLAPDFTAPLLAGGTLHLAAERGHPVVLVFWASWCGPCMSELPGVERVARRLGQPPHTARLYAVNTEGDRVAAATAAGRLGLTMPVVLDEGGVAGQYEVQTIPHTVVIDKSGNVAAVLAGVVSEAELAHAIDDVERR